MLQVNTFKNLIKKIPYIAYWFRVFIYKLILMRNNKHPRGYFYSGTASMESGNFETDEVELFEKLRIFRN